MSTRRHFVQHLSLGLAAVPSVASSLMAQSGAPAKQQSPKPPPLAPELVKAWVIAGHGNLPKVTEMLAAEPGLINAAWDWGGGDFETALGGASHVGQPEIAEYLLASGARLDVFCATMLGRESVVKACIAEIPGIVNVKGPHGLSLLHHAKAGKQEALIAMLTAAGAV